MFCPNCGTKLADDQGNCTNCGTPIQKEHLKDPEKKPQNLARGPVLATGGLKIWLWITLVLNGLSIPYNIFNLFSNSRAYFYGYSAGFIIIAILCEIAFVVGAFRLLNGYKDGFYIICAGAVIIFFANIVIGSGIVAFLGLVLPVIIWLLAREQWNSFQ